MTHILAIDPGNVESGWCVIDPDTRLPVEFDKTDNEALYARLWGDDGSFRPQVDHVVIEMIGHYGTGMPAGRSVFDTCVWIGQFTAAADKGLLGYNDDSWTEYVLRPTIKAHLCGSAKAKDPNVRQALVDRFAPGQPNHGKGTKARPGWFYGFHSDIWQAYALAVYYADTITRQEQDQ